MTTVHNILKLKDRRIGLRSNQTSEEIVLWSRLRRKQLGFRFRRQHSIGGYIADFYCPAKDLVIEIDGSQHFGKDAREYDNIRSFYFEGVNLKVLRFTNREIHNNIDSVVSKITSELKTSPLRRGRRVSGAEGV